MRCAAITKAGERCKLDATSGDHCYQHDPETRSQRRQAARRGGKAGGNGRGGLSELANIKREVRALIAGVLSSRVERGSGAVALQGFNTLLKTVEMERKIRDQDEILERIERLEQTRGGTHGIR